MRAYDAVEVIRAAANSHLSTTPYSYRKVGQRPTLREFIVPIGSTGYVLRFDIRTPELVLSSARATSTRRTSTEASRDTASG